MYTRPAVNKTSSIFLTHPPYHQRTAYVRTPPCRRRSRSCPPADALRLWRHRQPGERVPGVPHRRLLVDQDAPRRRAHQLRTIRRRRPQLEHRLVRQRHGQLQGIRLHAPSPSSSGSAAATRWSTCGRSTSSACSTPPATPHTSVFTIAGRHYGHGDETEDMGFGNPDFITREELERRRESLLKDDCLAIRCDVGLTELGVLAVAPKDSYTRQDDGDDSDWDGGISESSRRCRQPLDDREYIRRSLAKNRRA